MRREGEDEAVGRGVEGIVERTVGIEARDVFSLNSSGPARGLGGGKRAASHDLSIGLNGEGVDLRLERAAEVRIERGVDRAIGIEPRDAVAGRDCTGAAGLERREIAADENAVSTIKHDRTDDGGAAVGCARVRVEGEIDRAVSVEAGEIVTRHATHRGELPADEKPAIGLGDHGKDVAVDVGIEAVGSRRHLGESGGKSGGHEGGEAQETPSRPKKRNDWHKGERIRDHGRTVGKTDNRPRAGAVPGKSECE